MRIGRVAPNVGYQERYRREMVKVLKVMHKDVLYEIGGFYDISLAKDDKFTFTKLMAMLRKKWYKIFVAMATSVAAWFVNTIRKRAKDELTDMLKKAGILVNPMYNGTEKYRMREMIARNVKLIKSIPQKYLREVQDAVTEAWLRGGDQQYIIERIKALVSKKYKNAERRAELIARDQLNKITQQWAVIEAMACGCKKGSWLHFPGEYTSRETHIHMNKKEFDLNTGLFDEEKYVKRCVMPGELPFCQCQCEFIFGE